MQGKSWFASSFAGAIVAVAIVSSPLLAQGSAIGKGSWIISGSAGVNSQHFDNSDQSTTTISLAPSGLYFVSPGFAVGGSATFAYVNNPTTSSHTFGVGPSARYYFGDQHAKTLPFVSATIAPTWTTNDPKNSSNPGATSHGLLLEGTIGFTHLLVPHVGITGEAYYDHVSFNSDLGSLHAVSNSYAVGVRFGVTAFVF